MVEIYFHDLNADTQKALLDEYDIEDYTEMNWDTIPLATLINES